MFDWVNSTERRYNMNTYIDTLRAGALTTLSAIPDERKSIGILTVKKANETMREASLRPDPTALWMTLWYSGEVCCLFADSNAGKSLLAVQIADEIAVHQKILYFDFELSDKQFQLRYTSEDGNLHHFPENLYRMEISPENIDVSNFEDAVMTSIEDAALSVGSKVLIIDNLTYLCNAAEKGDAAGELMMRLMGLKRKHGWSILVLAHTPKRPLTNPISQNDLAGSKKIFNFLDSSFSIGKSIKDTGLRYIKQIKCRHGSFTYDSDNVITCTISKDRDFTRFEIVSYGNEKEHLKEQTDTDRASLIAKTKELASLGKSQREISKELGVSLGTVNNYLRR